MFRSPSPDVSVTASVNFALMLNPRRDIPAHAELWLVPICSRSRYELSLQIPALASPTRAARPPTPPSTLPSVSGPPGVGDRYRLALLDPNAFASWDEPLPACPVPGNYEGVRGRKVVLGVLARDLEASDLRFVEIGLVVRGGAAGKVWNGHGRGNSNGNIGAKGGDDERGSKGLSGTGQTNGGPEDGNGGVGKPHLHPSGEGTLAHARPSSSGGGVNAPVGASRRKIGVNNVMGGMLGSEGGFALRISRFFWRRKVV
ncbi:hypothetical protein M427DRAFT_458981 [Gonapodya prolifera JEL478]|uniref:Uncharacterized protein n=1 Tax=Gonapodya prolifera (strain JEL478) TaxID=1344416 RepID=A0A139A251_GONPJ|nr:hypothetical protein M427DRAFT_458981 [Gonapodya prolifera JEL478]|eukprot:KXS10870.1 hypothetical protein M427DRAFT_458981 [Gonapodya prolifera JEL478]